MLSASFCRQVAPSQAFPPPLAGVMITRSRTSWSDMIIYALLPPCKRWDKLKNKKLWTARRLKPSVWLTLLVKIGPTTQTCAVVSYNIKLCCNCCHCCPWPSHYHRRFWSSHPSHANQKIHLRRWGTVRCKGNKQICQRKQKPSKNAKRNGSH